MDSTDHYACTFKISPLPNNSKKETLSFRNTKNINMVKFIEELRLRTRNIDFTRSNLYHAIVSTRIYQKNY